MQDVLICDLFFPTGIKCKFSSFSASVPRRLCLIVNYSYSFALKTAAFQNVMKTPFPPFLSSLLILDVKRNVTSCPLAFARNVSYFIPALYRAFIVPRFSRIVSLVRLLFIFLTFKHPLFVSLSFFVFSTVALFPFLFFIVTFDVA